LRHQRGAETDFKMLHPRPCVRNRCHAVLADSRITICSNQCVTGIREPDMLSRVEERRGSLGHTASPRFLSPLIKPDVRISRIRLSDWLHDRLTSARHFVGSGAGEVFQACRIPRPC
jgi:hypothetical protein